jgi:predicted ATPase
MITEIKIERFKRFKSLTLPFASLTVLTGLNGAGKTSVIHTLLLFRSAARGKSAGVPLNGHLGLHLGEALDVLHRGDGDAITIELRYVTNPPTTLVMGLPEAQGERALYLDVLQPPVDTQPTEAISAESPNFTYLCAERLGPRDTLAADSADEGTLGVGVSGEYTAQVLALHGRTPVPEARLAPTGEERVGAFTHLHRQVERWMSHILGLEGNLEIDAEWFPGTTITRLRFKLPGQGAEWTRPPNMGFGVSYVLPIVVAALRTPLDGLLIVENPEAHLHPAGQSRMGEFLATVASDGVQVVLETHSDHVVNGIRRAVAEGSIQLPAEKVALHFFGGSGNSGVEVTTIGLRKSGELTAWPPGFFDQIEADLGAIARMRRRRS